MPILAGSKCVLRPLKREDLATSLPWRRDVALRNAIFGYRFPVTEENEAAWYERLLTDSTHERVVFAISPKEGMALLGMVRLAEIDWVARVAEFGIFLGDAANRGQGIGRQAAALILRYAFDDLNLERVHLRVAAGNASAIASYRKLGFKEEGVLRQHAYFDGAYHDVVLMGLLRGERAAADALLV